MADYQNTAQGLATLGRGGDSTLVHMNPSEVAGLQNLAARNGTSLTVNPNTGMPEAFNLGGLLPMVAGFGINAAFPGLGALMTGVLVGGATAVMEGDIMSGLGAGLGAYGGASLGAGLTEAATAGSTAGATTGEVVSDQITQNLTNMNPTIAAGPAGPSMTGFSSTAGSGTMGIPNAANTVTGNYPAAFQNNPVNSNVIGQGGIPQANLQSASAGGYQYTPNEIAGRAADNAIYNNYTGVGGYTPAVQPTVANAANKTIPSSLNQTGAEQALNNTTAVKSLDPLTNLSVDSISNNLSQQGEGLKNIFTDYSATRDAMGLDNIDMGMKFGMPIAGGVMAGLEPEDFQQEGVDMTQFEDRRFRGPDGQLNVEGKTGLNLKNPYGYTAGGYGYAEGGAVEQGMEAAIARNSGVASIASDKGMADALARNSGVTSIAPVSAPVSASNINVGGFSSASTNLTGGLGALNVNSGTVGQSPNAIKAAQVAAANKKANFKIMPNGQEVPIDFDPGGFQGVMGGMQNAPQSHYRDSSGNWHKGQKPGTFQIGGNNGIGNQFSSITGANYYAQGGAVKGYAEGGYLGGGDVNVQGDGMSDDIPANIDNEQPAALSEGEFVVPADVVSHIGNGSSEAGAKEFYGMMDRVRMARTGRKKQSPEIDPERFMPA